MLAPGGREGLDVLKSSLHSLAVPVVQNVLCLAHLTEGTERGLAQVWAALGSSHGLT